MGEFGLKCGPTKGYTDQIRVISVLESYNVSVSYPLTSKFLNQFITKGLIMLGSEEKCGVRLILPYPVQGVAKLALHYIDSQNTEEQSCC